MLVEINPVIDIVSLALQSAYIKPFQPVSILLISKPESAKTSAILQFRRLDFVYYVNEITSKMLIDMILPQAEMKLIRCLLIPDILNCIEKQKSTRQQFLNTMKSLIEEGISEIHTYSKHFKSKDSVKMGVITAITVDDYKETKKYMNRIGLLSRFLPFSYNYPIETIRRIFDCLEQGKTEDNIEIIPIIKKDMDIKADPELFRNLEMLSKDISDEVGGYGIRPQRNLQTLVKANAMINGRDEIIEEDVKKVMHLGNWINFKMKYMS